METRSYLIGKTQEEINFAASMWFMCREAYLNGEDVPEGVFFLTSMEITEEDKIKGLNMILDHIQRKNIENAYEDAVDNFEKSAESNSVFFKEI